MTVCACSKTQLFSELWQQSTAFAHVCGADVSTSTESAVHQHLVPFGARYHLGCQSLGLSQRWPLPVCWQHKQQHKVTAWSQRWGHSHATPAHWSVKAGRGVRLCSRTMPWVCPGLFQGVHTSVHESPVHCGSRAARHTATAAVEGEGDSSNWN